MEFTSPDGSQAYAGVVRSADRLLVGLDFDGTLSPIVEDPTQARIHPDAHAALVRLAERVHQVAVVTGRPARQVVALGGLEELGNDLTRAGRELVVLGQYGYERWSTANRRIVSPKPPAGLSGLLRELPRLLREADAADAYVEEKGLAVAVHTRRLPDAAAAYSRVTPPLTEAAQRHGLVVEPGRHVVEVRAGGMDKGRALRSLVEEVSAGAVAFVGDDLGDLEAFDAVDELRAGGMPGLLVCSASDEEAALRERADLVVDGPAGVVALLHRMADDAERGAPEDG